MATDRLTGTTAPRRPSFFETWQLLARGGGRAVWATLLVMVMAMVPQLLMPHGTPVTIYWRAFLVDAGTLAMLFGLTTWQLEGELGESLAFMSVIAQPVDPRRLLLAPMCALAVVMASVFAVTQKLPPAVALALVGVGWCTIGTTRWLWKLRWWSLLLALPILAVEPGVIYAAQRLAGWGAAAALSMVFAIGVLALQPRVYVGEPLSKVLNGGRSPARNLVTRRVSPGAASATASSASWLASTARFAWFMYGGRSALLLVIAAAVIALLGVSGPVFGHHAELYIGMAGLPASMLGFLYSADLNDFLRTRPFNRGQRFVGGMLPPLFLALLAPVVALFFVDLDWFNRGGLFGLFKRHAPTQDEIRYLREVLGATFLPEKWPAGGLSHDLWIRLRPLLYLDVLRGTLLIVAMLFAFPVRKAGERSGRQSFPPGNVAVLMACFATVMWIGFSPGSSSFPVLRLWHLALLACVSVAHWLWRVRVIAAPFRATDSSTAG